MDKDRLSREEIIALYKPEVDKLVPYLKWLKQKTGQQVAQSFKGQEVEKNSITFPVYDSTLLQLIRDAESTRMVDKNYVYMYSRYQLRDADDELRFIKRASLPEINVLGAILARYVLRGRTKAGLWQAGVQNGVLYSVIKKMNDLIVLYDKEEDKKK